jgi:hypothetical protein
LKLARDFCSTASAHRLRRVDRRKQKPITPP